MQWSRYNEFITGADGYCYLFNCRTRKWMMIDPLLAEKTKTLGQDVEQLQKIHPSFFHALNENSFIVTGNEEEMSSCIAEVRTKLRDHSVWKITVNPTLDCNLRCWYCYENHLKGSCMTEETIKSIGQLILNTLRRENIKQLQLAFFGGEPLLKFRQVVIPVLQLAKDACKKYGTKLLVSFTTNAVCLTPQNLDKLQTLTDVLSVQIPFDGNRLWHNQIKKFSNGSGSYDLVVANAKNAIEKGVFVNIRCNYTTQSLPSFKETILDFKEYHHRKNLRFSFHKVWQEKESTELKEKIYNLKDELKPYDFKSNISSNFGDSIRPCYGDFSHNIVINYNGDVFRCTARDFKREHRLGVLNPDGAIDYNLSAIMRQAGQFTNDCFACRRLPICPICTQVRSESENAKCPIHISDEDISSNIRKYFYDISGIA